MASTKILEDTTGPNAQNIATTDEDLSVGAMFHQMQLPSLGRQIFNVVPMHGPTAALFNIKKKPGDNGFAVVRREVEVFPSESIPTGLTEEVVQDIKAQYGKDAKNVIGQLLRGLANDQENSRTMGFLDTKSLSISDLQLTDSLNAETNLFEISQRVNELVLKANTKNVRTYEAFCVLPYYIGASISALGSYVGGLEESERGLFIRQIGQVKYFMNPDPTSTLAYVGLKDEINHSRSSAVFSPFEETVSVAYDPDSGEHKYFIFNRFAITESPLHETDNEMLFKFNVLV